MKNPLNKLVSFAMAMLCVASVFPDEKPAAPPIDATEAKYTQAIEGRVAEILKVLELKDSARAAKVHDIVIAQYRSSRAWHDENDPKLKAAKSDTNQAAQIRGSLKSLHNDFIAKLSSHLDAAQVDQVKDKMTYNKVQVTYNAYCQKSPDLNADEKTKILEWLKEAREEAMDAGSAEEKSDVFNKYKGKINNHLSRAGYDLKTGAKKQPAPVPDKAQTSK